MTATESEPLRRSGNDLSAKAIASAFEAWTKMKPLILSAAFASALLGGIFSYAQIKLGIQPRGSNLTRDLLIFIRIPLFALVEAPLAIATHRLIILGEVTPGLISLRKPYHWLFFIWVCALEAIQNTFSHIDELVPQQFGTLRGIIVFVVIIPSVLIAVRSALVFPALAVEVPSDSWRNRLQTSWRQMDGNFWFFVRAALITIILLLVLTIPAGIVGWLVDHYLPSATAIRVFTQAALSGILNPVYVMVFAGVASWLFIWVRENGPAQVADS